MTKKICIVGLTVLFSALAGAGGVALLLRPVESKVEPVDMDLVADGVYTGIHQNKILFAVVQVDVQDAQIAGIEVLFHKESYMRQAEQTAADIVTNQTLEVDSISGATLTCDTVKKAVQNALLEGIPAKEGTHP